MTMMIVKIMIAGDGSAGDYDDRDSDSAGDHDNRHDNDDDDDSDDEDTYNILKSSIYISKCMYNKL